MKLFDRVLFGIARWVAGRDRAEWIQAMATEAESVTTDSSGWALGCLWAAAEDRFARDWWVLAAVLMLPAVILWWKLTVFFATGSLIAQQRIPDWLAVTCWILSPFPFAFVFALFRGGRSAHVAIVANFLLVEAAPLLMMFLTGTSPSDLFAPNFNWYKCDPGVRIGLMPGVALDFLAWAAAVLAGSALRRRYSPLRG